MAATKEKEYIISVDDNPNFCGIGAGGTQFALGKARIKNEGLARWFSEHKGYTVKEV